MQLLQALLNLRPSPDEPPADAACQITIVPKGPRLFRPKRGAEPAAANHTGSSSLTWGSFAGKAGITSAETVAAVPGLLLSGLPPLAAGIVWAKLSDDDKRNVRLASSCRVFARTVGSLQVGRRFRQGDMRNLSSTFPDLNTLTVQLGPDPSSSSLDVLKELRGVRLPHLHTFACDVKLKGDVWLAVARFLVHTPSLRVLQLPDQRAHSPTDQRLMCAVLEALLDLTMLDLGGAGSSRSGSNAITPSLMRRITKLRSLRNLSCNASAVPDDQLAALSQLPQLRSLSLCAHGTGRGLCAALLKLTCITHLEVQHPSLDQNLLGCLAQLAQLQVLNLGLCPKLADSIVDEVSSLQQLERLSLPFPIQTSCLCSLSKLPQLVELLSFDGVELDVLGPAHDPLAAVTKLVCSSIDSHGKPLSAIFPSLQSVILRSCGDMEAFALGSCAGSLSVLVAGNCGRLTDEGFFAAFRTLRNLTRLQLDNGSQLSDLAFAAAFGNTMPNLQHVSLSHCARITDTALQLLTASCRRLSSISINDCAQLTDKTLKRLARCDHLTTVNLKHCMGFTTDGVAALVAAPQVKTITLSGCQAVSKALARGLSNARKLRIS